MVNSMKKTQDDVKVVYERNRGEGIRTERELELLREQVEEYTAQHAGMTANATQDMDSVVEQVRQRVKSNVNSVLNNKNIESERVQTTQIDTAATAQADRQGAMHNRAQENKVSQPVVDVIGQREHEAIKHGFQQEAEFHGDIDQKSQQDQRQVQQTTHQTNVVVEQTLSRLNNLI